MIRSVKISLKYANKEKQNKLNCLFNEVLRVKQEYINQLWKNNDFSSKFVNFKVDSWLSARMLQNIGKQALETVKSQRKKKNKSKPICKNDSFSLDSRFIDIQFDRNSFDIWIKLSSLGNKLRLKLPSRKHVYFFKYNDWQLKNTIQLCKQNNKIYAKLLFEKELPKLKDSGKVIGIDIGYKDLIVTSDNQFLGHALESVYEKISRKKQGSNAFKRTLSERDNLIGKAINLLNLNNVKELVAENLKDVKKDTRKKKRLTKKFTNKLQRWSYSKVLDKLSQICEENGILFTKINPAYTSQKCSVCGEVCKSNRKGKIYKCSCGNEMDADLNAAINISHMGVYSPHALYQK